MRLWPRPELVQQKDCIALLEAEKKYTILLTEALKTERLNNVMLMNQVVVLENQVGVLLGDED